ncbi:MAG TPA: hypothetical protein VGH13_17795 [Xanthobacteraceae bacterium]
MVYRKNERIAKRQRQAKWNNDILQIVRLVQERFQVGEVISDPVQYVEEYKSKLTAAGPELRFLLLAKPDKKSPFGWCSTPLLKELMSQRGAPENGKPLYDIEIMYQLLCDSVFGRDADRGNSSVFTWEILSAVGSIQRDEFDDEWVTEGLHNLFYNGYFRKRREDGLEIFPKMQEGAVYSVRVV